MSGWSIHADDYDADETYMGETTYDPDEDAREQREDMFAAMGFFPHNPADGPDPMEARRAQGLREGWYR